MSDPEVPRIADTVRYESALKAIQRIIERVPGEAWSYGQRRGMSLWKVLDEIDGLVVEVLNPPALIDGSGGDE